MIGWTCPHCGEPIAATPARRRWSKEEIDALYEAVDADIPWTVVAERLGRSYKAVTQNAYQHGLRRREGAKAGAAQTSTEGSAN